MRALGFLLLFIAAGSAMAGVSSAPAPVATSDHPAVAVIFALKSNREHFVPWHRALTVDAAIRQAAPKKPVSWQEAWRYRQSFWTRNFRNPHSFWARILAGERATGYTYFQNTPGQSSTTALRPGDRIYVDLAPIAQ